MEQIFCKDIMELSLSRLYKQDTEGNSISTHFLIGA